MTHINELIEINLTPPEGDGAVPMVSLVVLPNSPGAGYLTIASACTIEEALEALRARLEVLAGVRDPLPDSEALDGPSFADANKNLIWEQGYEAYDWRKGLTTGLLCPYPHDQAENRSYWFQGWRTAKYKIAGRMGKASAPNSFSQAYELGFEAFRPTTVFSGLAVSFLGIAGGLCPFEVLDPQRESWFRGWNRAAEIHRAMELSKQALVDDTEETPKQLPPLGAPEISLVTTPADPLAHRSPDETAQHQGYVAYTHDVNLDPEAYCLYPENDPLRAKWFEGWNAAKEELGPTEGE